MFILRPYKTSDNDVITGWVHNETEFYQWTAGFLGTFPPKANLLNDFQCEIKDDPHVFQLVACESDIPVGYLSLRYLDDDFRTIRFGFIIIDKEKRKKGYGHKMLKAALTYSFEVLHAEKVVLGAFDNNPVALSVYLSVGFRDVTSEPAPTIPINGENWTFRDLETHSVEGFDIGESQNISESQIITEILDSNHFRYAFQPIVSAQTGEIYGYEALMRAELDGPVSPLTILESAEKAGRLYDVEKATFFNVLKNIAERQEQFDGKLVFINSLPGHQLNKKDYQALHSDYSKYVKQVVVEITESTELNDQDLELLIQRSKKDGFGLAIDDYGTGYSNTGNLLRYLPNCVKIDRLLISDIHQEPKKQHFVRSLVEFAHENGFLTLAEGVETFAELRSVIEIGVDLIQGYYTGRPSFEVVSEIAPQIRNEIINANVRGQTQSTRNVYVVEDEKELPLMRVALEKNTGILISQPEFTLVGNRDYTAAMNVKIKDNTDCRLVLRDVLLECFQDLPCIELGENVNLTIVLEGENALRKVGICVPASSSVTIVGEGNLTIRVKGIQSYGIGNYWDSLVGDVTWNGSGLLDILVEADDAIAIGGGKFVGKKGFVLSSGNVNIELASSLAIGIGCSKGECPISISDVNMKVDMKVERGIGIGCLHDNAVITIANSTLGITGAGNMLTGIGSNEEASGVVTISDSTISTSMNGQTVNLLGTAAENICFEIRCSSLNLKGEGSSVMGIGSRTKEANIKLFDTLFNLSIRSAGHIAFGAEENNIYFERGIHNIDVNK